MLEFRAFSQGHVTSHEHAAAHLSPFLCTVVLAQSAALGLNGHVGVKQLSWYSMLYFLKTCYLLQPISLTAVTQRVLPSLHKHCCAYKSHKYE